MNQNTRTTETIWPATDRQPSAEKLVWLVNLCSRDLSQTSRLRTESLGAETCLPKDHLGLLYIAEYVRQRGLSAPVLCDGDAEQMLDAEILKMLMAARPWLVGFSTTQAIMRRVLQCAKELRTRVPDVCIVLGGHQAAFTASEILLGEPDIDGVIVGEGEFPFHALVQRVLAGNRESIRTIAGLVTRPKDNATAVSREEIYGLDVISNLDEAPWVGAIQARQGRRHVAIITSRGCFGRCSFCSTPNFNRFSQGRNWRPRSAESVVDEISQLVNEYRVESVHIHDPDFVGIGRTGLSRANAIVDQLEGRQIHVPLRFTSQASAAALAGVDFWRRWRRVGLEKVFIGLESGDEQELRRYKKPSCVHHAIEAHRVTRKAGVAIQAGFIMFNPLSTRESICNNLLFLNQVDQAHYFRHVCLSLSVYPGTRDFDEFKNAGLLSYDKPYLEVTPIYKDSYVGKLATCLGDEAPRHQMADGFLLDVDFAFAGRRRHVDTHVGRIAMTPSFLRAYRSFRSERGKMIQAGINRLLDAGTKLSSNAVACLSEHLQSSFLLFVKKITEMIEGREETVSECVQ